MEVTDESKLIKVLRFSVRSFQCASNRGKDMVGACETETIKRFAMSSLTECLILLQWANVDNYFRARLFCRFIPV